ncbi:MAG: (2Fe-2S)-binding protein [Defluviitaleaceae bacterium]|nr:(2Fe-2S)-binding protein [Defluviitaleaceae bacterium]
MRIINHPILGEAAPRKNITFNFNGEEMTGFSGEPIAAALRANNIIIHRYTRKFHSPRGVFCAIGRCTDCVMIVNGRPNVRTCVTALEEGMTVTTQYGAGGGA